jgi:hypothetical protein
VLAALGVSVRLTGDAATGGLAGHSGGCRKRILSWFDDSVFAGSAGFAAAFRGLDRDRYRAVRVVTVGHLLARPVPGLSSRLISMLASLSPSSLAFLLFLSPRPDDVMSSISSPSNTSRPRMPSFFSSRSRASIRSTHSHTMTLAAAAPTHLTYSPQPVKSGLEISRIKKTMGMRMASSYRIATRQMFFICGCQ